MVDLFSLALTHALMALAIWRLLLRDDLDRDPEPQPGPPEAPPGGGLEPTDMIAPPSSASPVPRLPGFTRGARGRA